MANVIELRQQRKKLCEEQRALLVKSETEGRASLSAEEEEEYERRETDIIALATRIDREERQMQREGELRQNIGDAPHPEIEHSTQTPVASNATPEYRAAFQRYLLSGSSQLSGIERRALQADSDILGGYLVAPQQFLTELIMAVDDLVFMRRLSRVIPVVGADSLGAPSLDADPADADWTAEITAVSGDTAMAFGKRELHPHPLTKEVRISRKLLRQAALSPEALVRSRLAYKFAITEEKAFLSGSGSGQPLGVFTASAQGIPTSRDVSTGNTTTSITFDGLIECKYSMKGQYWTRGAWIFHRDALKQIRKLKDGEGRYIWQPSVLAGQPERILENPYYMSEYAPNTFTTGLIVGIFGDFSNYWIADSQSFEVQVLTELYAATNQNGYIGRQAVDGMPVLAEAFARVKLA